MRETDVMDPAEMDGADGGGCPDSPNHTVGKVEQSRQLTALLGAIAGGDRRAFADFYDLTCARVYGLSIRVLHNRASAEEITWDVFMQIWSSADHYDPALASPIGWLTTLTHRRAVGRVRSDPSASRTEVVGHIHLRRDRTAGAEHVEQWHETRAVAGCLDTLTETQREAICLAYYGGLTCREVSVQLQVDLPTIESRVRDGLIRLNNCLR